MGFEADRMDMKEFSARRDDWVTIALPIVLMLTGLILMGGDFLGVLSLDRIQNLWPVALIAIGATDLMPVSGGKES
jgi:hypothetical protein